MKKFFALVVSILAVFQSLSATPDFFAGDKLTWEFAADIPQEGGKNLLISPQNCWHALSLVYLGAEGSTRSELERIVNPCDFHKSVFAELIGVQKNFLSPHCTSAAAFFVSPKVPIRPEYQEILTQAGLEKIETLNFMNTTESMNVLNEWVSNATKGKISKLVTESDIDQDTVAMLIAALHFKASWQFPFQRVKTHDAPFYTFLGETVQAPMMNQVEHFYYASLDGFEYVSLPYTSEGMAEWEMELILLPEVTTANPSINSLPAIAQDLRTAATQRHVDITVPRFKTSMRWDVRDTMEKMGITIPFSNAADFSGISEVALKIQKVFQECCIDVTEEGTEGAAATAVGFSLTSFREVEEPIPVVFNRPFYFVVRERFSGAILFFGLIENPNI